MICAINPVRILSMKLPKVRKRGSNFSIEFIYKGRSHSCTRDTAKKCEQWAALKLLELKTGKAQEEQGIKPHFPLSALFDKYYLDYYHKTPSATHDRTYMQCGLASNHSHISRMAVEVGRLKVIIKVNVWLLFVKLLPCIQQTQLYFFKFFF